MNTETERAIAAIDEQQKKEKTRSAPWMVGEQLKEICRQEPRCAEIIVQDLQVESMSIVEAEKKIKAFADAHKTGNFACVTPMEAELLEKRAERVNFEADLKRLRETGLSSREYLRYTFADDDLRNREHSNLCRKYVELWGAPQGEQYGAFAVRGHGDGEVLSGRVYCECAFAAACPGNGDEFSAAASHTV